MMHRLHRCGYCGNRYTYQSSGQGCGRAENDAVYCHSCKRVQLDALANIPRKFEGRYRNVREIESFGDVTLEAVLEWERVETEERERRRASGQLVAQRIFMGLIKNAASEDYECQRVRAVVAQSGPHRGISLKVATWPKSPEYEIEVEMEYDLVNKGFTKDTWR